MKNILTFLLLHLVINVQAQTFLATFPANVYPNSDVKFCVKLFDFYSTVSVSIENMDGIFVPIGVQIQPNREACLDIRILNIPLKDEYMVSEIKMNILDGNYNQFSNTKRFAYHRSYSLTFVETDKQIYKPGQSVKLRVLTLDYQLKAIDKVYNTIYVTDSRRMRVHQWNDRKNNTGLINLELPISHEPNLGSWEVVVEEFNGAVLARKRFEVQKYVLPKFELKFKAPSGVLFSDSKVDLTACAKYSFGKGVKGRLDYIVSLDGDSDSGTMESEDMNDCMDIEVDLRQLLWNAKGHELSLKIKGNFTEDGTGKFETGETRINLFRSRYNFELLQPSAFKYNEPTNLKIKLTTIDGMQAANKLVTLVIRRNNFIIFSNNFQSDESGLVSAQFYVSQLNYRPDILVIEVKVDEILTHHQNPTLSLQQSKKAFYLSPASYSLPRNHIRIYRENLESKCDSDKDIEIILKLPPGTQIHENLHFQIQSPLKTIYSGRINTYSNQMYPQNKRIKVNREQETTFKLTIQADSSLSSRFTIFAFYKIYNSDQIVSNSEVINVEQCLNRNVTLSLSESSVRTNSDVRIRLAGEARSVCALSALDKSLTFIGKRNNLEKEQIFERLSKRDQQLSRDFLNNYEEAKCDDTPTSVNVNDFKNANLILFTNLGIYKNCHEIAFNIPDPIPRPLPSNTIRTFFPESWIWDIEVLNESGLKEITKKTPDSITDWIFDAYCISRHHRIGIASPVELNVIQPLFVNMNLPYSVINGETFPVMASVFNYLDRCIPVEIKFASDVHITLLPNERSTKKVCICPEEKVTHTFKVKSISFNAERGVNVTVLGTILDADTSTCTQVKGQQALKIKYSDAETRSVKVEPEGTANEFVRSMLVHLKGGDEASEEFRVELPENLVPKSSRVYLAYIGDPIGPMMDNLDHLVELPTGCGEQNMVKYAPLVSLARYLNETKQLDEQKAEKILSYLKIGYQQQLKFRHFDGSFSAWGANLYSRESGGTWLTAFVLRCLSQSFGIDGAKVHKKDLELSLNWLLDTQNDDGSFKSKGKNLFLKELSRGLEKNQNTGLSAYVLMSLLTTIQSANITLTKDTRSKLEKGLDYVQTNAFNFDVTDTYLLSLVYYALKLGNRNDDGFREIEKRLESRVVSEGEHLYWTTNNAAHRNANSADIEITSYILLAKLHKFDRSHTQTVDTVIRIVKWLNKQRNSLGGFTSTQDTVVALEALSRFASIFYSKEMNLRLTYAINGVSKRPLSIKQTDRLVYYKPKIHVPDEQDYNVKLTASGIGSAVVQFVVKYNTRIVEEDVKGKQKMFNIGFKSVTHDHYSMEVEFTISNNAEPTLMAIVSVKLPTGWAPSIGLEELKNDTELGIDDVDTSFDSNKIHFYFNEITQKKKKIKFMIERTFEIKDTHPGSITVYDYYNKDETFQQKQFTLPE